MKFKGIELFLTKDLVEGHKGGKTPKPLFTVRKTPTGGIAVALDKSRKKLANQVFELYREVKGFTNKTMEQDPEAWFEYMVGRTQNNRFFTKEIKDTEHNTSNLLDEADDASTLQYKLDL